MTELTQFLSIISNKIRSMAVEKPRVKVNETNFGFRGQKHTFEVSISGKGTYNDSDERVKWKD